jgi:hypothetical protein
MFRMWNQILSSRYCFFAVITSVLLAAAGPASAFGLSDDDYVYLARVQHLERYNQPVLDIGPLERTRLHDLINDPRTANDPGARDKNVKNALDEFLAHQLWECRRHLGKSRFAPVRNVTRLGSRFSRLSMG